MNILVTGAGGQLGSELRDLAEAHSDWTFHFFDRSDLPLDNAGLLAEAFDRVQPSVCINAAAYTAVDKAESEKEQAYAINGTAVGALALLCARYNALLLHVSTDYVFNGEGKQPYRETDPVSPLGVYGASKLEGERLALAAHKKVVIVRTSWVYSYYGKNFVKTMLRLLREKESIGVVADQLGRPTYARNLAKALLGIVAEYKQCSDNRFHGVYHYADRGEITWFDLASAVKELIQAPCVIHPLTTAQYPTPARRPAYSVLDTTRIEEAFDVDICDWKDSLRRCLARF
ncbi:dTDP-4-dehydrorhamnose reductase [Dinghuibacter silviterrae]|uniref:dTDP-4-dehydrorhamnose reductase n=1 Tax=Dinghuibacter silviterrae TaxID=1539049 RepID=A0A4R8DE68_9BACT|nr:dTDP-4-dehydrorhamnose reductase [Dinghuibacter silviterrae]TDW95801.1 dTDP-4-dehydrorhamnose reductase [Dinghuibacter silviterrae]